MPFAIGVEVTRRCNFTCAHCFVDAGRPRDDEMSTAELRGVLDDLAAYGTSDVGWSGGEPLLRKDLAELTAYGSTLGLRFGLVSNGFLGSHKRLSELRQAGLGVIQISLDGPDAVRAHRFRQGPSQAFDRAVAAIQNSVSLGLATYVCALLTPDTAAEIDEMVTLSRQLGAHGLRYTMWAPVGRASGQAYDETPWQSRAVAHFLRRSRELAGPDDFIVAVDCPTGALPWRPYLTCTAGRDTGYIYATGEVFPCTALLHDDYLVGNLRETPLLELLRSKRMLKVHRQRAAMKVRGTCTGCAKLASCAGGCPGRTLAAYGRLAGGPHQGAMPVCLYRLHPRNRIK